ncbi:XtrA/YqaO family protein [Bacillus gobiensis]|uniref:Uncharacterized protein n=1 Tax=Bacillus gobiensis TaxID=1441095 RepID=A0A0M4FV07_9BACI|nr:XtrA/YqaO family protein [Bacillus gobiensis]ALC80425.1 hypothetical protein AM592_01620 [Bacillus gobiensis]
MEIANDLNYDLNTQTVTGKLEKGKIQVIVLDGIGGKVKSIDARHHGDIVIKTVNGKLKQITREESELW